MEELRDGNNVGDHLKSLVSELIFLIKRKRRKLGTLSVILLKYHIKHNLILYFSLSNSNYCDLTAISLKV